MKKITKRVATYMLAIAGLTKVFTSCNEENEEVYSCNKLVKIKNRLKILVLLPILALVPTMLKAQMGNMFTTTSAISIRSTIDYTKKRSVLAVKTVNIGNDSIISLIQVNNISELHLTVNGTTTVKKVRFYDAIVEDFTIDTVKRRLYICGQYDETTEGMFGGDIYYSAMFNGTVTTCPIYKTSLTTNITKMDLYRIGSSAYLSMIAENNIGIYAICPINMLSPEISYFVPPDGYKLLDVKHTKNYVVFLGYGINQHDITLFRHAKKFISPFPSTPPLPTIKKIDYCNYSVTPNIIKYEDYNCHITALDDNATDSVMVGVSLSTSTESRSEFALIKLSDFSVQKVQDMNYTRDARPEICDMQYNKYSGKVLCLGHNLDDMSMIIYEIDPDKSSDYTTNLVNPLAFLSYQTYRGTIKSLCIYSSNYYLAFGQSPDKEIIYFDKKFGTFGGICHIKTTHDVLVDKNTITKLSTNWMLYSDTTVTKPPKIDIGTSTVIKAVYCY